MSYVVDPRIKSWIPVPDNHDFPIQNIPFGLGKMPGGTISAVTIIGDQIIDLAALEAHGYLADTGVKPSSLSDSSLNALLAQGKAVTRAIRRQVVAIFSEDNSALRENWAHREAILFPSGDVELLLPVEIKDYTDFYSSRQHATNVGKMFRDPENALLPNWLHLPVGYHGRASSIVVSGTPITRPKGQTIPADSKQPVYGASRLLDFELEMAFIIDQATQLGDTVSTASAEEHIFGISLFNDWSARDIQKWEYVPLGPFLGKNFGSSVAPWIVTLDALEPFRLDGPVQEPAVLPYLQYEGQKRFNIELEVYIQPEGGVPDLVARSNFKNMYWNMAQQLAHHTVNGCNINTGDLYASGTISGDEEGSYGSMLEITWRGSKPIQLSDGTERKFLQDGDTVIMKGYAQKDGLRIGLGEVRSTILPARPDNFA
ncbi:MAG: fumarylacetoacetase [Bacteroidota bacterium]